MKLLTNVEQLSNKEMKYCEHLLNGATHREALKLAGYKREDVSLQGDRRIKQYLLRRRAQLVQVVDVDEKLNKLADVMRDTIYKGAAPAYLKVGISAISELNKMQGHYAPTQSQNLNINVDQDTAKEVFSKLLEKHQKDY